MTIKMLIDASHEEETRVAIVHGSRVEEFDYESSAKKQIKGNVYLAKITRVEPSLQAAFVEYGGNRHGFLAFSEIHPDYYQIPVSDREKLIAEEAAAYATLLEKEEEIVEQKSKPRSGKNKKNMPDGAEDSNPEEESSSDAAASTDDDKSNPVSSNPVSSDSITSDPDTMAENTAGAEIVSATISPDEDADIEPGDQTDDPSGDDDDDTESAGSHVIDDDEAEEKRRIKIAKGLRHKYKIQEVIKKNQILLIQVVKEERGNKGAALTTYLSLPGRYCVLMPNSLHGGGVSRKIANTGDRKSLKKILADLNMPSGIACIIRTAGQDRTKTEIKRDYDYLIRTWQGIRERTLESVAPTMINEEGDLIKRSIRDLYTRDVEEILVEGEKGYKIARSFMRLLMPSHARKIKHYTDDVPLLHRYQVESQLDSMYSPTVQLKSGGYIVINPTEALVSIDVNSGKATKEHNIEETAKKTNLEAAEEIARQLRLRDMAGLIVIDFIDMEVRANNRAVEQKIKECLKSDRARIQISKISTFGLMEMSRQRLRAGVLESSTRACPHCEGSGVIRSIESQVLHILRALEEEGIKGRNDRVMIFLPEKTAIYMLNHKREKLVSLEKQYAFILEIAVDSSLTETSYRLDMAIMDNKKAEKQDKPRVARQQGEHSRQKTGRPANTRRNRQRNQSRRNKGNSHDKTGENEDNPVVSEKIAEISTENTTPEATENQDSKPRRRRRSRRTNKNPDEGSHATAEGSRPTAEGSRPTAEGSHATAEGSRPTAEGSRPTAEGSRPTAEGSRPTAEGSHATAGQKTSTPPDRDNAISDPKKGDNKNTSAKPAQKTTRRPYPPQARNRKKNPENTAASSAVKNREIQKSPITEKVTEKVMEKVTEKAKTGPKKTGWWQRTFG